MSKKKKTSKKTSARPKATAKKKPAKKAAAAKRGARRSAASRKTWIVTTSSDRPIDEVAKDLAKAGLGRHTVLKEIGSIVGSAGDDAVPRLKRVRGVTAVEAETPIDIGPPNSPTTW